jgi:hypothetical protein
MSRRACISHFTWRMGSWVRDELQPLTSYLSSVHYIYFGHRTPGTGEAFTP